MVIEFKKVSIFEHYSVIAIEKNLFKKKYKKKFFQSNIKEIKIERDLPYGVFSYTEKIINEWINDWKSHSDENNEENVNEFKRKIVSKGKIELFSNNLGGSFKGIGLSDWDSAAIRGNFGIFNTYPIYYFEIKILEHGRSGFIGIGLAFENCDSDALPGWQRHSFGYHADDGKFFNCTEYGEVYGPRFSKGDIIGLCWNHIDRTIFFTKNGIKLPIAIQNYYWYELPIMYPIIGLRTEGEIVMGNFGGASFQFDLDLYFDKFKKFFLFKEAAIGEIKSMKKFERKIKHFNRYISRKFDFLKIEITNTLMSEIIVKKQMRKISSFCSFKSKKNNNQVEEMESINKKIYPKIFIIILKKITICLNFFFFSKYWTNPRVKNNYIKKFKDHILNFSIKKSQIIIYDRKFANQFQPILYTFSSDIWNLFSNLIYTYNNLKN